MKFIESPGNAMAKPCPRCKKLLVNLPLLQDSLISSLLNRRRKAALRGGSLPGRW